MEWLKRLFGAKGSSPDEALASATDSARAALGNDLVSAIAYGSFATGEYIEGYSNVNLLLVTRRLDAEILKKLAPVAAKWKKYSELKPLFFSLAELKAYSEAFPMEFADIAETRQMVGGEDVFTKIQPGIDNLAEELQNELQNRLVKLRQRYILSGGDEAELRGLLAATAGSLFPILRAFLRLKKRKPPRQRIRLIEEACRNYRFNRRVLLQAHDLRYGRKNAERIEPLPLFEKMLQELALMADAVSKFREGGSAPEGREPRSEGREEGRELREEGEGSGRESRGRDRDRGRGRDRDRGRDRERSSSGSGGDRNGKLALVRNMIVEAGQRKKWEPKEPERFGADEFSRDTSLSPAARFGWDKAWQPERRAKGYVQQAAPAIIEEPTYEEEFGEQAEEEAPAESPVQATAYVAVEPEGSVEAAAHEEAAHDDKQVVENALPTQE